MILSYIFPGQVPRNREWARNFKHQDSIMLQVSYIVNNIFSSRTYVLSCEGNPDVWLVDCGDVEKLPADCNVKGVLLTHAQGLSVWPGHEVL